MVYIRVKKIKNRDYAYLVSTQWQKQKKQAKQTVSQYLGRVFAYSTPKQIDFLAFVRKQSPVEYLSSVDKNGLLRDFVAWEFAKHAITDFNVNCDFSVLLGKKEVTIKLNDGFMNKFTLQQLFSFKKQRTEGDGFAMAKCFVDAGIAIPKEIFIEVFSSNIFK